MLLSKAITLLQSALQEHGDIPLRLYADHGQTFMNADAGGIGYSIDDDYYLDLGTVCDTPEGCEDYCVDGSPYKFYSLEAY